MLVVTLCMQGGLSKQQIFLSLPWLYNLLSTNIDPFLSIVEILSFLQPFLRSISVIIVEHEGICF